MRLRHLSFIGTYDMGEIGTRELHEILILQPTTFKGGQRGLRNIVRRLISQLMFPGLPKREGKLCFVTERRRRRLGYTIGVGK